MSNRKQAAVRFAVGTPEGPQSAIWRLWVPHGKSDVYLAARSLAGSLKVSLHVSGQWQHSFTSPGIAARFNKPTRHIERWTRPPGLGPGVTLAYRIIVPWSSATLRRADGKDMPETVWVPQPPEGHLVEFQIWFTGPSARVSTWPGQRSRGTVLVSKVPLANAESVWVTALTEPAPDSFLKEIAQWQTWWKMQEVVKRNNSLQSDIRTLLFGNDQDGSRFYADIVLTEPDVSS